MPSSIVPPFSVFNDLDGSPLENGYIYIGTSNLNPETSPVNVYWDAARTIPAAQPIRTIGGFPSRNGSPSNVYIETNRCSITVRNSRRVFVYSVSDAAMQQDQSLYLPLSGGTLTGSLKIDNGGVLKLGRTDTSTEGGQIEFCRANDNTTAWRVDVLGSDDAPRLRFFTSDEKMTILANGHVGIGTVNPSNESLEVCGDGLAVSAPSGSSYGWLRLGSPNSTGWAITKESTDNTFNIWEGGLRGSPVSRRFKIAPGGEVTLYGPLVLPGDPSSALQAATKAYVDALTAGSLTVASFTGSNQSLAGSGYQKLPGGLILQWGPTADVPAFGTSTFNYPMAFPNAVFVVIVSYGATMGNYTYAVGADTSGTTQFTVKNTDGGAHGTRWIALGY